MWQRLAKLITVGIAGLAVIFALVLTGAVPAAALDPCAVTSTTSASLTFVNNSGADIDIYSINSLCVETQAVNDLANGASSAQTTFNSVKWLVRDSNTGAPLLCVITNGSTTHTIVGGSYQDFCNSEDGRLNLDQCDNEFVVYQSRDEDGNPTLNVFGLTTEVVDGVEVTSGELLFTLESSDIADLESTLPEENTRLEAENGIRAYLLTSGEWQINGAPDAEGKECVLIFDALLPADMYHYTSDLPLDAEITETAAPVSATAAPTATP